MYRLFVFTFSLIYSALLHASGSIADNDNFATVYIMRNDDNHEPVESEISVNGDYHGSTYGQTYLVLRLPEGNHNISSEMNNVSDLEIQVEASKTYFIQQKINAKLFSPRNKLVQVDSSKGLELIWMCKAVD